MLPSGASGSATVIESVPTRDPLAWGWYSEFAQLPPLLLLLPSESTIEVCGLCWCCASGTAVVQATSAVVPSVEVAVASAFVFFFFRSAFACCWAVANCSLASVSGSQWHVNGATKCSDYLFKSVVMQ